MLCSEGIDNVDAVMKDTTEAKEALKRWAVRDQPRLGINVKISDSYRAAGENYLVYSVQRRGLSYSSYTDQMLVCPTSCARTHPDGTSHTLEISVRSGSMKYGDAITSAELALRRSPNYEVAQRIVVRLLLRPGIWTTHCQTNRFSTYHPPCLFAGFCRRIAHHIGC